MFFVVSGVICSMKESVSVCVFFDTLRKKEEIYIIYTYISFLLQNVKPKKMKLMRNVALATSSNRPISHILFVVQKCFCGFS